MKKRLTKLALGAVIMGISIPAQAANDWSPVSLDLELLANWFEGEFDNSDQLWFDRDPRSKTAKEDIHQRLHTTHIRLDKPEFGKYVFYVEEFVDHDPSKIIRQRLVIFSSDHGENADRVIRMRQGFLKDTKKVRGGKSLNNITEDDLFFLDECDVFWKRDGGQFEAKMKPKACVFGEGEKRRYSVHNMSLSPNRYWRVDTTFLISDNTLHSGVPLDRPIEMKRAHRYDCEITFRDKAHPVQKISDLSIHSEGGTAVVKRNSDGQEFEIMLRAKEYPFFNEQPDFLYFSIRKYGEDRAVAFSVSDLHSRRIGFNAGGIVPHCARVGYTFRETLTELDAR